MQIENSLKHDIMSFINNYKSTKLTMNEILIAFWKESPIIVLKILIMMHKDGEIMIKFNKIIKY
jgi:hypothetical protein